MPPPRRRRPVQPATRVRLPRTSRPQAAPANGTVQAEPIEPALDQTGLDETALDETALDTDETVATGPGPAEADEDETLADETADGAADSVQPGAVEDGADAGEADDEDRPEAAAELPGTAAERDLDTAPRESLLLPICVGVVTVALAGLAIWFGLNTGKPASTGFGTGSSNLALTNSAATAQVNQQIDNAVDTIFSYNYTDTTKTSQAAKNLLTGKASGEYATLFKVVQQDAPAEKLILTTTVTNSGVEMLNNDTARLLIFANQKDTGATKASTTEAGAMFSVTAVRQDGRWKIEDINTFGGGG